MKSCHHSQWLSLTSHDTAVTLQVSDRLHRIKDQLPGYGEQPPSLVLLIGNRTKDEALRHLADLTKGRWPRAGRSAGDVHLHISLASIFREEPMLFADGDVPQRWDHQSSSKIEGCHKASTRSWALAGSAHSKPTVSGHHLFSGLLAPLADVVCIFSADLGGTQSVATLLALWVKTAPRFVRSQAARPRLVIVTDEGIDDEIETAEFVRLVEEHTLNYQRSGAGLPDHFSSVDVFSTPRDGSLSPWAQYWRLKQCIRRTVKVARVSRTTTRTLYSATHFTAFFELLTSHFASSDTEPFNFIKASRTHNPVALDLPDHLTNYLKHFTTAQTITECAVSLIASSILVDFYPPGMHVFDPEDVFDTLYRETCRLAARRGALARSGEMMLPSTLADQVLAQLVSWFSLWTQDPRSSAVIHAQNVRRFASRWNDVFDDHTCLMCLRRKPQYGLDCHHAVCELCVKLYGEAREDDPYVFELHNCVLCDSVCSQVIKVQPDETRLRVLTIDGGGTRGVAPLQYLRLLEDQIDLPYPVQDNFDVAFAPSSGAFIVLALFYNGWSVRECAEIFERLATVAFKPRDVWSVPFMSPLLRFLISYFRDCRYPAAGLELALRTVFGTQQTLMDCSYASRIGAKIGIPVTTVAGSHPLILTNYNGTGDRRPDSGYEVMFSYDPSTRVQVYKAARASSAAPGFFTATAINGILCQDGGLCAGNPVILASKEAEATSGRPPSSVISFGTGECRIVPRPSNRFSLHRIWKGGFIDRVYQSFMSSLDGQDTWRNYLQKDGRNSFVRFNFQLESSKAGLDDLTNMYHIKQKANLLSPEVLARSVDVVNSSNFYFRLCSIPSYGEGSCICQGHILDRLSSHEGRKELLKKLSRRSQRFWVNGAPIPGQLDDSCFINKFGRFSMKIEFEINGNDAQNVIRMGDQEINNSPFTVNELMRDQGMYSPFGRADNLKRGPDGSLEGAMEKKRRL